MYYAVAGSNAFGVYEFKERINNIKDYINNFEVIQCRNRHQAFCLARDIYNDYQEYKEVDDCFYGDSLDIHLNRVYFTKEIRAINKRNA